MGLRGDRSEGHRAGCEPLDDLGGGLDLLERKRLIGEAELEEPAQVLQLGSLVVDHLGVLFEFGEVAAANGVLKG